MDKHCDEPLIAMRIILASVVASALLAGCSVIGIGKSEFSCDTNPADPGCASPAKVYDRTNSAMTTLPARRAPVVGATNRIAAKVASVVPMVAPAGPQPVLEPATVLRIWIAPWVDDKKALHWPSYIFAEVTPRRWSFGDADFRGVNPLVSMHLVPIQVDRPSDHGKPNATTSNPTNIPANLGSALQPTH